MFSNLGNILLKYYRETEIPIIKNFYLLEYLQKWRENPLKNQIKSIEDLIATSDKLIAEINNLIKSKSNKTDDQVTGLIDKENTIDIWDALRIKSLPAVKYHYKQNPQIIHQKSPYTYGENPLHIACELGCLDIVRFLVSNGADIDAIDDLFQRTPLQHASVNGHLFVVEFLLNNGASIIYQDTHDYTPLHDAVFGNNFYIVTLLIEKGADVSSRTFNGQTPLDIALSYPKIKHSIKYYLLQVYNLENHHLLKKMNE